MKDKFCISKTLTYLVVLVAAVVGTFFLTNYVNNQKLTSESEAARKFSAGGCSYRAGVVDCISLPTAQGTYENDPNRDIKDKKGNVLYTCCTPIKSAGVPASTCSPGGLWYKTSTYSTCSEVGPGYTEKTGVTETKD